MALLLRPAATGTHPGAPIPTGASRPPGHGPLLQWLSVVRCPAKITGMPAYLLAPGPAAGLIGTGRIRSGPVRGARDGQPGTVAYHLLVEWFRLLPIPERIPLDALAAAVPSFEWRSIDGDLVTMPGETEDPLAGIWRQWVPETPPADPEPPIPHPRPPEPRGRRQPGHRRLALGGTPPPQ